MLYLKRPRDGYRYAEILRLDGFDITVKDAVENVPIELHSEGIRPYAYQENCMKFLRQNGYKGLVALDVGLGKAQPLDTPLLTTEGFKTIGTVQVGDYVYNRHGKPVRVVAKSEVWKNQPVYKVHNTRGAGTKTHANHEWLVYYQVGKGRKERIATTEELYKRQERMRREYKEGIRKNVYQRPVVKIQELLEFSEKDLPIDPYVLGYWLGDGNKRTSELHGTLEDYYSFIKNSNLPLGKRDQTTEQLFIGEPRKDKRAQNGYRWTIYNLLWQIKGLKLYKNKHIPDDYLFSSKEQRLALLQGLMDSDGSVVAKNGVLEFSQANPQIAYGAKFILDSLGIRNGISKNKSYLNGEKKQDRYRINFKMKNAFRLKRKREKATDEQQRQNIYIEIEKTDEVADMQCIQVDDSEHTYLANYSLIPTHNSIITCKTIEELGKGPILIVAPSSLLYQWQKDELLGHFNKTSTVVTSKIKKDKRIQAIKDGIEETGIVITNYEFLRTIDKELQDSGIQWELMVLDEAHKVKNWGAKISQVIANIPARRVIGLTGTPVVNHLKELYHITDQITPGFFGTMSSFYSNYVNKDMTYKNLEGVYDRLNDLMYRKKKRDVLKELPKRITQTIYVELTNKERAFYEDMLAQQSHILAAISNAKVFGVSSTLRMEDISISSKEKELKNQLKDLEGQVILFCESKMEVEKLGGMDLKRESYVLHGGSSKEKREEVRQAFKESDDGLLLMTEIGTEGLNLQYAGNLVNFSIPWTYSALEQRIGRIERMGSEFDTINVINMLTNDTIDLHVADVVANKAHLFDMTVNGAKKEVSKNFVKDLFKMGIQVTDTGELQKVRK
jgi:superfamily II DNA or RNA helicase